MTASKPYHFLVKHFRHCRAILLNPYAYLCIAHAWIVGMFTHIKEFSKFLMLAGFVSMMTACEQVQSEVVSFSSLAPQAPGGAYYVLPSQEQAS